MPPVPGERARINHKSLSKPKVAAKICDQCRLPEPNLKTGLARPSQCDSKAWSQTRVRNAATKGKKLREVPANIRSIRTLLAVWARIRSK
jgi:hypothetical protein